ncbi:MAG: putative quinol monooxygenase [Candidatus Competibacteraceae bacterium]|jgi:quinol monooxygenase YgiN|nr:putative quinol monooxygenase [Candidatus Competibacteraceae bacterium]
MAKLTIVANITAKAGKTDLIKAKLEKLIDTTRAEAGCLQYDLHQDNENPAHFMFYENWESRELWQAHMHAQHIKDFLAATDGAVETFTVNEMTMLA